jgi:hypothetical protein
VIARLGCCPRLSSLVRTSSASNSLSLGAFDGSQSTVLALVAANDSCGRSLTAATVGAMNSAI